MIQTMDLHKVPFKTVQYAFESNNYSAGDTIIMPSLDASGNLSYYDFGGDELRNLNKNFILVGVKVRQHI